jgi:hypothetical protein
MGSVVGSSPERARQMALALALGVALALGALASPRVAAAAAGACSNFTAPGCGDAAGDAFCAPGFECTATGAGCDCRPRLLPDGASCAAPTECASTFCADGVCCNTACNEAFQTCNAPPVPGTCIQVAPAPPVSRRGLFAGLALLTMVGAAALGQQRRAFGGSST